MDYGARFYDPGLGRFTQPDTIVPDPMDPQSLNRYSYVSNNPVRYTDPTGHAQCGDGENCSGGIGSGGNTPTCAQAPSMPACHQGQTGAGGSGDVPVLGVEGGAGSPLPDTDPKKERDRAGAGVGSVPDVIRAAEGKTRTIIVEYTPTFRNYVYGDTASSNTNPAFEHGPLLPLGGTESFDYALTIRVYDEGGENGVWIVQFGSEVFREHPPYGFRTLSIMSSDGSVLDTQQASYGTKLDGGTNVNPPLQKSVLFLRTPNEAAQSNGWICCGDPGKVSIGFETTSPSMTNPGANWNSYDGVERSLAP